MLPAALAHPAGLTPLSVMDYTESGRKLMSESIASYVETRKRRIRREAAARDARIAEARLEVRTCMEGLLRAIERDGEVLYER